MAEAMTLVGLDVHARQTHAAVLDPATGELGVSKLRMAPVEVASFLEGLGPPVRAVYEAGPTGFGLARTARERGVDVRVAAPGSIPKGSGDRVKTDRRDAVRLVRLLAAGELSFAFVPSVADERFRDLVRGIEDVRGDLMRARHRLGKFLLRRGERYPESGAAWTGKHMKWLRALAFEDACSQATFLDYLAAVELLMGRRATLIATLEEQIPEVSHAPVIARLRCFRGIDTLSAAGLCAEIGQFGRFPKPSLLSGFLGIVPSERTSDQKRRQGAITKAGPTHARRLLVEAAHHYRHPPRIGQVLARRQEGQDPRVVAVAWRAQRRLNGRWQHLHRNRRKPAGVVAVACARELAAFLWEAATLD
ncbi:MAG: IS110 family transposase [Actinobacteria bacterium]|nr:IS110 family transposase [Actinomycetota bacterium]